MVAQLTALLTMGFVPMADAQAPANWTQQAPGVSPSTRDSQAMAYDSTHKQTVLFGGMSAGVNVKLNDTWLWDGSNWTPQHPQTSPSVREGMAMAFDSQHGQAVMFGGFDGNFNELNETWVWEGSNWTEKFPQTSPTGRFAQAMVYDSAHGQVVMFGGVDANFDYLNDTWLWDGSNWTQQHPHTSPPGRWAPAMAFDAGHGQAVLFGGQGATAVLNDTWVWDGSNWTQKSPQPSPSTRAYLAMAYDSAHTQVILFGGDPETSLSLGPDAVNDTWVWDGSNWTQKALQTSPPSRSISALAYDSAHDVSVLFGGVGPTGFLNDTWTWSDGPVPVAPPPGPAISGVASASAFGDFASAAPGSWVEIYGTNLAPGTRQWAGTDFTGNNAPTMLDGVTVSIGGQQAFLDYISSTQVNAQLPSNIATGGTLPITVTNGVTSAPVNLMINATQPGLLAPPNFKIGANQYVVAQHSDGSYVAPTGAIAGAASRPATAGETIEIYGVGFGSVLPATPAGEIATGNNQLSATLQISFGQTLAPLTYSGLAPGFVGLYQFDVVVPAVAATNLTPLELSLGGVPGTQTLVIAVQ